jgi:hypothetical protein
VPGKDCWGYAEGMLNPVSGMLADDEGVITASYMIRCALPSTASINLVDYTGKVVHFNGEIGLASYWAEGDCDQACQENVSACLMAFTNATGVHVPLEMSSTKNALGGGNSSAFKWQEGAFFGNLFNDPPRAFFCKGTSQQNIATMWYSYASDSFDARMCTGYQSGKCPYKGAGDCTGMIWSPKACSKASDGTYTSCKGTDGVTYQRPITTYLKDSI